MPRQAGKVALTDRRLRAVKPAPIGKRVPIWDAVQPHFCARVSGTGQISFFLVRRREGERNATWFALGRYPVTSLAQAREKAREVLGLLLEGKDPLAVKAERKRAEQAQVQAAQEGTFRAVAERYINQHLGHLRSARSTERIVRDKLIAALGDRPIAEIRRRDVIALVEAIAAHHGTEAARRAQRTLSSIFSWAVSRDIAGLEANPAARCKVLPPTKARDRVLRDSELRAIWRAVDQLDRPWRDFYRVLMLTGQRLREIAEARWSEIDLDVAILTIPAERMKGGVRHVVPLAPSVAEILRGLPRFDGGDFVFSTTGGRKPITDIAHIKARLDAILRDSVQPWWNHDLRRTMRTALSAAGVPVFVAELVIGHAQSGVHAVYDLHRYDSEKRDALMRWEARFLSIVGEVPPAGDVVPMPARAQG
jgi:integrase